MVANRVSLIGRALFALLLVVGVCSCGGRNFQIVSTGSDARANVTRGTLAAIGRAMERESRANNIPGGVLAIVANGEPATVVSFGFCSDEKRANKVTLETLFDVASLTKPLAGVPSSLLLRAAWENHPHDSAFANRIISHTGGLNDEVDFPRLEALCGVDSLQSRADAMWQEYAKRATGTNSKFHYANSGYALLSLMMPLDAEDLEGALRRTAWASPDCARFTFDASGLENVAATGYAVDGSLIRGHAYDPLAACLLATSHRLPLHSGMFATAPAVAGYVDRIAFNPTGGVEKTLQAMLFGKALEGRDERNSVVHFSRGGLMSPTAAPYATDAAPPGEFYYQTGYTGCLLWVDLRSHITLVLLTNASLTNSGESATALSHELIRIILLGRKR